MHLDGAHGAHLVAAKTADALLGRNVRYAAGKMDDLFGADARTFAATDAKGFVDCIFEERFFYKFSLDGIGRAKLVFGSSIQRFRAGFEIAAAQITIPAHGVNMDALDSGRGHDTSCRALSAMGAKGWV